MPQTLAEMEEDTELQQHLAQLQAKGQAALSREDKVRRQRSLDAMGLPSFYAMSKVCSRGRPYPGRFTTTHFTCDCSMWWDEDICTPVCCVWEARALLLLLDP